MMFVRTALDLTEDAVYSLHKSSTREVRAMCWATVTYGLVR